jgi:hypothetical protein
LTHPCFHSTRNFISCHVPTSPVCFQGLKDDEKETNPDVAKSTEVDDGEADDEKKEDDSQQPTENAFNPEIIFARDVEFSPHPLGGGPFGSQSYNQACPTGGPGGLICCDVCCTAYSQYLTQTAKDIELQRTEKAGKEVNEILEFLEEGRAALDRAAKVARKIIPPLPLRPPEPEPLSKRATSSENGGGSRKAMNASRLEQEQYNASMSWNLTSAIDIGSSGYDQI